MAVTPLNMSVDQYVPPKQLIERMAIIGVVGFCERASHNLVKAMRAGGMPVICGNCVRPSDAYAFLQANPDWRPFGKKNHATK